MSATIAPPAGAVVGTGAGGASAMRVLRAECVKLGTLRSNIVTLLVAFALIPGLAAVQIALHADDISELPLTDLLAGVSFAQFPLVLLAAILGAAEWAGGTASVTFLAVPARWPVLLGKALAVGTAVFVAGAVGTVTALTIGHNAGVDVTADPGFTARLITGTGLYLGTVAVLALTIGVTIRTFAATLPTVIAFLWMLPFAAAMIPLAEAQRLAAFLPITAGGLLLARESPVAELTPWGGYAVLAAWTVLALVGAVGLLRARDI